MVTLLKPKDETILKIVSATNLRHIAIIMDGNRRWAKKKLLPSAVGHQQGVEALKKTLQACKDFGIKYLTVYAFSTENWNRKKEEVDFLMGLLAKTLTNELGEMHSEGVRIRFIGDIATLSDELKSILQNAQDKTKENTGVNLQIAFNYGSRLEIVEAVKKISGKVKDGDLDVNNIDEELISDTIYTASIPDPDLLIRTGGECRVSNYLLWQIAYTEFLVIDKFWPEFNKRQLELAVLEFQKRNRRYGK